MTPAATPEAPAASRSLSGRIEDGVHRLWLRVYYEDTDAAGIVYYANYLRFAERARTEMLRLAEVQQSRFLREQGLGFAVKACEIDYRRPSRLDDLLEVRSWIVEATRVLVTFRQDVLDAASGQANAVMTIKVVCLGPGGRPARIPAAVAAAMNPYRHDLE